MNNLYYDKYLKYKKTYLCPKAAAVVDTSNTPVSGNKIIGNKAVTPIGITSVIHQSAIQRAMVSMSKAFSGIPSGVAMPCNRKKERGPESRNRFLRVMLFSIRLVWRFV